MLVTMSQKNKNKVHLSEKDSSLLWDAVVTVAPWKFRIMLQVCQGQLR